MTSVLKANQACVKRNLLIAARKASYCVRVCVGVGVGVCVCECVCVCVCMCVCWCYLSVFS